jgi:hypothetical protein
MQYSLHGQSEDQTPSNTIPHTSPPNRPWKSCTKHQHPPSAIVQATLTLNLNSAHPPSASKQGSSQPLIPRPLSLPAKSYPNISSQSQLSNPHQSNPNSKHQNILVKHQKPPSQNPRAQKCMSKNPTIFSYNKTKFVQPLIQQITRTQNLSNSLKPKYSQKTSNPTQSFVTQLTPSQKPRPNNSNLISYIVRHIPIIKTFYTISNRFLLILGGDIELNPGPIYNLLRNPFQITSKEVKHTSPPAQYS